MAQHFCRLKSRCVAAKQPFEMFAANATLGHQHAATSARNSSLRECRTYSYTDRFKLLFKFIPILSAGHAPDYITDVVRH
jgi:hypothetical protein